MVPAKMEVSELEFHVGISMRTCVEVDAVLRWGTYSIVGLFGTMDAFDGNTCERCRP